MREKLIELLEEAKIKAHETIGSLNGGWGAWYADYLLENSVVALPCEIDAPVFIIPTKKTAEKKLHL